MNKKAIITLTAVLVVLAALQLACSLTGIFADRFQPAASQPNPQAPSVEEPAAEAPAEEAENSQTGSPGNQNGTPNTNPGNNQTNPNQGNQNNNQSGQNSCTNSFNVIGSPSIPTGQQFAPGQTFEAKWQIHNTGTCEWNSGYSLVFFAGDSLSASDPTPLGSTVVPGDSTFVTLVMTAPSTEAEYVSLWKLSADSGQIFGMDAPANNPLRVLIEVVQPTVSGSGPGANLTPMPLGTPNVTGPGSTQPAVTPIPAANLFVESEANQITLGEDQCFDLINGVEVSCSSSSAHFKYDVGNDKILWGKNGLGWGDSNGSELTKTACMGSASFPDYYYITASTLLSYRCFKFTDGNDTYYGWIRVTYFNPNQVTFDYLTYAPF